jgi:hypothetical protein
MSDEVTDLRKSDRFLVVEPIEGTFNGVPVGLANVSLGGVQLLHAQPIRLGTRGTLTFNRRGVGASVAVTVVWSHLAQTSEGLRYRTGVILQQPDVPYATALNGYVRSGVIALDTESLDRKRQRELEREMKRKSGPKLPPLPPS